MKRQKLSRDVIDSKLASLQGWAMQDDKVGKTYSFDTYAAGSMFATAVGCVADSMDHHPDILIGYRKVNVAVNSHDVGGISERDFELAARVDRLLEKA